MPTEYQAQHFYKHVDDTEMIDMQLKKLEELFQQQNRLITWIANCMCAQLVGVDTVQRHTIIESLRNITGDGTLC